MFDNTVDYFCRQFLRGVNAICKQVMLCPCQDAGNGHQAGGSCHAGVTVFPVVFNRPHPLLPGRLNCHFHPRKFGTLCVVMPRLHQFIGVQVRCLIALNVAWPTHGVFSHGCGWYLNQRTQAVGQEGLHGPSVGVNGVKAIHGRHHGHASAPHNTSGARVLSNDVVR